MKEGSGDLATRREVRLLTWAGSFWIGADRRTITNKFVGFCDVSMARHTPKPPFELKRAGLQTGHEFPGFGMGVGARGL